jgi:YegS/Rv2252/BmrU family lipid kinase
MSDPLAAVDALFIVNPIAGGGRARRIWARLQETALSRVRSAQVRFSERLGHPTELAAAAAQSGVARVVVVGGDGTVQEAVAGLLGSPTVLGVVPAGTGNDFSRTHLIPRQPELALGIALGDHVAHVDLGRVNGRPYVNVAGVGFDAEVAAWTRHRTRALTGPALYVAGIFAQLLWFSPKELRFSIDERRFVQRCLVLAVGTGKYYGGGMMMCPRAEPADGWLDVCVAGDLGKLETLQMLPLVFSGRHLLRPKISYYRARTVTVESDARLAVHADGEPVGTLPAVFDLLPAALPVAVPANPAST